MERTVENLKLLVRAGKGEIPADMVVKNGKLINVMTGEIYPADLAVYKDTIVAMGDVEDYIGPDTEIIDAKGKYLSPGLIDGHIHIECSKLSMTSFAKAVVPRGTTSLVSSLDQYIAVSGLEGLKEVMEEIKGLPLNLFWGAPYKTPYTIPKSTVSFNFTPEVHEEVQKWKQCVGVWETVTESVTEEDPDTLGALELGFKNRLPILGCAPMARGKALNSYLSAGVRLDHESYDHEEVLEKMRKGMNMVIRESSVTHFLAENIKAVTEVNPALARRVSFCTDDVTATDVIEKGHLDNVVRLAMKAGVDPMTAIQMGSINSAEAYRIDHLVGSLSIGRLADILIIDSPEEFNVEAVISRGKLVARDHKIIYKLDPPERSDVLKNTMKCKKTTKEDFEYKVDIKNGKAKVLAMNLTGPGPFVRKRRDVELDVVDGVVQPDTENDVAMVSVLERFGRNGNKSLGFASGWTLKKGAMASSAAPDDNNIVVLGVSAEDMSIAVNYLIDQGGGQVIVCDGEILDFLPLPVGGIVSDLDPEEVSRREIKLNQVAKDLGCMLPEPLMYMFFLPITSIPDFAITDVGPVDYLNLSTYEPVLELIEK